MVKFGAYLAQNIDPTISVDEYLNYNELKGVIKRLTEKKLGVSQAWPLALGVHQLQIWQTRFRYTCSLSIVSFEVA
jgi:hypothetical protein